MEEIIKKDVNETPMDQQSIDSIFNLYCQQMEKEMQLREDIKKITKELDSLSRKMFTNWQHIHSNPKEG